MNGEVKELKEKNSNNVCGFCNRCEIESLKWGPMYRYQGVTVHYFCLLFSAGLNQNGDDEEGILGFLPKDIFKEFERGKKLRCKYCRQIRATVGCSVKKCKASFHFNCGLENGSAFQFLGNFEAYCKQHRTRTIIPLDRELWECPICYENVTVDDDPLWPPCCQKAVFHRECMLESAKTAGAHFFKCPLCNDKDVFMDAMKKDGVYVPDRDALWELERGAFQELTSRYGRCDKEPCLCPNGREFDSKDKVDTRWKIVRCGGCGATAVHKRCAGLELLSFKCSTCSNILAGTYSDNDDDDGTESRETRDARMRAARNRRQSDRIIRRYDTTCSSEDEEQVRSYADVVNEKSSNVEYQTSEYDSDETGVQTSSWKEVSVKTKDHGHTLYGQKKYKVLVEDDPDDSDEDESDNSEDEEQFVVNETSKTVSILRKSMADTKYIRLITPRLHRMRKATIYCENVYPQTRSPRFEKLKNKLDKLRNLYMQIPKADSLEVHDSHLNQVRTGLVEVSYNSTGREGLKYLVGSADCVKPGPSNRALRNTVGSPLIKSITELPECTNPIEKVVNIFQRQIRKLESPLKDTQESKTKPKISRSVVETVLNKFLEKAVVKPNVKKDNVTLPKTVSSHKTSSKEMSSKSKSDIKKAGSKTDSKMSATRGDKRKQPKEKKSDSSSEIAKNLSNIQHTKIPQKTPKKTKPLPVQGESSKKHKSSIKRSINDGRLSDEESIVIGTKTPSKAHMRQPRIDAHFSPIKPTNQNNSLELANASHTVYSSDDVVASTSGVVLSSILVSCREKKGTYYSPETKKEITPPDSATKGIISDDEDCCILPPEPTISLDQSIISIPDDDDDIQEVEVVNLVVKTEDTKSVVFDYNHGSNPKPVATAFMHFADREHDQQQKPTTYFSGRTCLSEALIANSEAMIRNTRHQKRSRIVNRANQTGPGLDDEIVIELSDEEDGTSTSGNQSRGDSGERVPLPNRDENGNTSNKRERRTGSEESCCSDGRSKRPRVADEA